MMALGWDGGYREGLAEGVRASFFIVERKGKLGLGTAYIRGFKWAIEHKYDFIFRDGRRDFSLNPNDLPKLYAACTPRRVPT